ncbi:MAG: methyltransferase domain-containing protein [Streptosporangiales bacterium]|nr:methyltransferase domain-containing protein [Streptosporangiales bacterium]
MMRAVERSVCRSAGWGWLASRVILPRALAGVRPAGDVLEMGCGGGAMAAEMLAADPAITLTALDIDPSMVDATMRRLGPYGHRARAIEADCADLPFEAGSFDTVVSFLMLHHVGRWEDALGEVVRVLRPGGLLAGCDALDTRVARWFHQAQGARFRSAGHAELRRRLESLPLERIAIRTHLGGVIATFSARRAPGTGR